LFVSQLLRHADSLMGVKSDYKDDGTNVLLDANENAYGPGLALDEKGRLEGSMANGDPEIDFLGLHRYPDP
jgi:histidinol-phosphate aminotransferase